MKNLLNIITAALHIHNWKPIVSMYVSFESRDIIYECKCGKRVVSRVYRSYDSNEAFPIPTNNFLSYKEFQAIANGAKFKPLAEGSTYIVVEQ